MKEARILKVDHFDPQSRQKILTGQPILSSQGLNWDGLIFNYYLFRSFEVPEHSQMEHSIGICLNDVCKEEKLNGKYISSHQRNGFLTILPKGHSYGASWKEDFEFCILSIKSEKLSEFAPESFQSESIELIPNIAPNEPDYLVSGILNSFKQELEYDLQPESSLIEHLQNALLAHLLQKYCSKKHRLKSYDGLPPYKLKLAINYINDNLHNKIELAYLATLLDISPGYFGRLFRESTGISPYRYILQQRVNKAQKLMEKDRELSLTTIAKQSGFNSLANFSRQFSRLIGISPGKYRSSL